MKQEFTSRDLYVRTPWRVQVIALMMPFGLINVFIRDAFENRWLYAAVWQGLFVLCMLFLQGRKIEIHGDTIICRNYLWRKRQYDITQIALLECKKHGSSRVKAYGTDNQKLFSMHGLMEESAWAVRYLESRGVRIGKRLAIGNRFDDVAEEYEEAFASCCEEAANSAAFKRRMGLEDVWFNLSFKRVKYLAKQKEKCEEAQHDKVRQVLSCWGMEQGMRKQKEYRKYPLANGYVLMARENPEENIKLSALKEQCIQAGIQIERDERALDGSLYKEDAGLFYKVCKEQKKEKPLGFFLKRCKSYKKEFYQAGEQLARLHREVNARPLAFSLPGLSEYEEVVTLGEASAECLDGPVRTKFQKLSYEHITQKELDEVINQVKMAYETVPEGYVLNPWVNAFAEQKGRTIVKEELLYGTCRKGLLVNDLCTYFASLGEANALVHKKRFMKRWKRGFSAMCKGYQSVRPFTEEERMAIRPLMQAAVIKRIANALPEDTKNKLLRKMYRDIKKCRLV